MSTSIITPGFEYPPKSSLYQSIPVTSYTTWAALLAAEPASAANRGKQVWVNNLGQNGLLVISTGVRWKVASQTYWCQDIEATAPLDTVANTLFSHNIPANFLRRNDKIGVTHTWEMTAGGSATNKTYRVNINNNGMQSGNFTGLGVGCQAGLNVMSTGTLFFSMNGNTGELGAAGAVPQLNFDYVNNAVPLTLSMQKATASDNVILKHVLIEIYQT